MKRILTLAALVAMSITCHAQENAAAKPDAAKPDMAKILEALKPSAVRVEFTFKYDDNVPPPPTQDDTPCPSCGRYHGSSSEQLLKDERPFERMGWLIAPDTVLIADTGVATRFIESIVLALPNGKRIPATQHAIFARSPVMLLKTETPVPNAAPLAFDAQEQVAKKGLLVDFSKPNTEWNFDIAKLDLSDVLPTFNERRGLFWLMEASGLFLSEADAPLGFLMSGEWNPEKPLVVPPFDAAELIAMRDFVATGDFIAGLLNNGIHLATLNFRSPRQNNRESRYSYRYSSNDEDDTSSVQYAIALHFAKGRLLVLKSFNAKQTARLESITLQTKDGSVPATFAASLENFGAFIIEAPELTSAPLKVRPGDMRELAGVAVAIANIDVFGDQLSIKHDRARFGSFSESWKDFITADLNTNDDASFAFTTADEFVAFPVKRRNKSGERYSSYDNDSFSATVFAALIANPPVAEIDPANIPLSEREENRIAWLGVELQELTAKLAQEMKIAHLTSGMRYQSTGAIVSFVYPGSPAERAGLKTGDVLLRIFAEDRAKPHLINLSDDRDYMSDFPWSRYDSIPAEYFDRIPTPWPPADNTVNKILTSIGFGKTVRVEAVIDGEIKEIPFVIEVSPDTYESAPQFEATALGLNARDITFEVRHYFRRKAEDPGVIVSRVEPGQHAAVAGIRPYELILKVNDTPVHNIAEFEEQLKDTQELQLTVRRMNRERIVRINLAEKVKEPKEPGLLDALRGMLP